MSSTILIPALARAPGAGGRRARRRKIVIAMAAPPRRAPLDLGENVAAAAAVLRAVRRSGGALAVLTGAGMSVQSGVPVFRAADGTMSPDFLRFLSGYNAARRRAGLREAPDWFDFSVPEMFRRETEAEAWAYWRWRMLRADVEPGVDYRVLAKVSNLFGKAVFVTTSNCDGLHLESAGVGLGQTLEVHGALGFLQCSVPCCEKLWEVDSGFMRRLQEEEAWVPRCTQCGVACLRPNVMIFNDHAFVPARLEKQEQDAAEFERTFGDNFAVLEIGAGTVVPSIRLKAEALGSKARCLIRINQSAHECATLETDDARPDTASSGAGTSSSSLTGKYFPLVARAEDALLRLAGAV